MTTVSMRLPTTYASRVRYPRRRTDDYVNILEWFEVGVPVIDPVDAPVAVAVHAPTPDSSIPDTLFRFDGRSFLKPFQMNSVMRYAVETPMTPDDVGPRLIARGNADDAILDYPGSLRLGSSYVRRLVEGSEVPAFREVEGFREKAEHAFRELIGSQLAIVDGVVYSRCDEPMIACIRRDDSYATDETRLKIQVNGITGRREYGESDDYTRFVLPLVPAIVDLLGEAEYLTKVEIVDPSLLSTDIDRATLGFLASQIGKVLACAENPATTTDVTALLACLRFARAAHDIDVMDELAVEKAVAAFEDVRRLPEIPITRIDHFEDMMVAVSLFDRCRDILETKPDDDMDALVSGVVS